MKLALVLGVALVLVSAGCAEGGSNVPATRRYSHVAAPFTSLEECLEASRETVLNCRPSLTLCSNGGFVLLVTDIINEGRYVLEGSHLVGTLGGSGDGPADFEAIAGEDGSLTSDELGDEWRLEELTDAERQQIDETSCAPLEGRTWW